MDVLKTHDKVRNVIIYLHTEIPCQLYLSQLKQYPKKEDKHNNYIFTAFLIQKYIQKINKVWCSQA